MACSDGYVKTGAGTVDIYTCVSTDSKNVYVTLEGDKTETWPFQGYVKFKLQRASGTNSDVWVDVSTKNGGFWENSRKGKRTLRSATLDT